MSTTDCSKAKNWGPVYFKRSALLGRIKNRICLVRGTAFILTLDSPGRTKSMLSRYISMTWTLPWQNRQDTDSSSFSSSFSLDTIARPLIVFHVPSADGVDELNWLSSSGSSSWFLEQLALSATAAFSLFWISNILKWAFVAVCQFCGPFFVKLALRFLFHSRFWWRKRTQPFLFFGGIFTEANTKYPRRILKAVNNAKTIRTWCVKARTRYHVTCSQAS